MLAAPQFYMDIQNYRRATDTDTLSFAYQVPLRVFLNVSQTVPILEAWALAHWSSEDQGRDVEVLGKRVDGMTDSAMAGRYAVIQANALEKADGLAGAAAAHGAGHKRLRRGDRIA